MARHDAPQSPRRATGWEWWLPSNRPPAPRQNCRPSYSRVRTAIPEAHLIGMRPILGVAALASTWLLAGCGDDIDEALGTF
jgi:hypothetical protein